MSVAEFVVVAVAVVVVVVEGAVAFLRVMVFALV